MENVESVSLCIIFPLLPLPAPAEIEKFQSNSMTLCIEFLQLLWTIKRNFYLEETQGAVERGYHLLLLLGSRRPSRAGVWKLLSRLNTVYTPQDCVWLAPFIKMSVSFFVHIGLSTVIQTTIQSQE